MEKQFLEDKKINSIFNDLIGAGISFDESILYLLEYDLYENFDNFGANKKLPPRAHLIDLLKNNKNIKMELNALFEYTVDEFIEQFKCAQNKWELEQEDEKEEKEQENNKKQAKKMLAKSLSKEQKELFQKAVGYYL